MAEVYIGTSGFYYPHWVGNFYPKGLDRDKFLSFYSQHFNTVEINSSFYHTLKPKTVVNWSKSVPSDFVFSFKMSRFITHIKKLIPEKDALTVFFKSLEVFKNWKTKQLVLIQTPPSLKNNEERLKNFIGMLPKNFFYAFEFRHPSWFEEKIYKILKNLNIAVVLSDSPNNLWPKVDVETANFFYIRFHGSQRLFSSSYNDEELKFYGQLIKKKLKKGLRVFVYFNNDAKGWAVENAKQLGFFSS
jgi:uncharacterized protein YecE (DUF72 family)